MKLVNECARNTYICHYVRSMTIWSMCMPSIHLMLLLHQKYCYRLCCCYNNTESSWICIIILIYSVSLQCLYIYKHLYIFKACKNSLVFSHSLLITCCAVFTFLGLVYSSHLISISKYGWCLGSNINFSFILIYLFTPL